jgi:hypothetical protein
MAIYPVWVRRIGTFVIPLFLITNFGPMFLLGQLSSLYAGLALAGSLLLFEPYGCSGNRPLMDTAARAVETAFLSKKAAGRLYAFGHLPILLPLACVCRKLPAI